MPDAIYALLAPEDVRTLQSLVRVDYRRTVRSMQAGARKWGREFDATRNLERLERLEGIYRSLGGDPERIRLSETEEDF